MQDADLFMELAAIAGVFVGFGALIAVRSGGPSEPQEIAFMRAVVLFGVLAVVAALAPVSISRYGLADHQVWALSSILVAVGFVGIVVVQGRTPEYRGVAGPRDRSEAVEIAAAMLYALAVALMLILIVLGVAPDLEAALYFTVVVVLLLGAAWLLIGLAYRRFSASA
jgi:hypothetical protein